MGARVPPNERPRRGGVSCEFCGRAVPSVAALRSHQIALHSQALKEKSKRKIIAAKCSQVQKAVQRKAFRKKPISTAVVTHSKTLLKKRLTDDNLPKTGITNSNSESSSSKKDISKQKTIISKPKTENTELKLLKSTEMEASSKINTPAKVRKVEYKCPKCDKLFSVLFVAQKHIQKYHCVNSKDEKVSKNSPHIIQPIMQELCVYCNNKYSKAHQCPDRPDPSLFIYSCLGCKQQFKNNKLFDLHVIDVHGYHCESLFFPSKDEFSTWKGQMETQTECKYTLMGKYNSKEVYRCSEHDDDDTDCMFFCPSSIISTSCKKGIQINFYPSHYQHDHKKYDLKDQYKTFTITDLIQQAGYSNGCSDDDLYLQFKTLMESIVLDAAKINIGALKTLMDKATDMMSILQEYDEDEEVETVNRSSISLNTSTSNLRDDNDCKPTDIPRTRKRGLEENETPLKKLPEKKKHLESPKILVKDVGKKSNTFSLADSKDSDKILKELDSENIKANRHKTSTQSPSFNDTYRDFLMSVTKTATSGKNKNVVKTKIGQFKGPSPKKNQISIGTTKDIDYEVRDALSTKKKQSSIGTAKDIDYEVRDALSTKKKQSSIGTAKDIDYEVRDALSTKKKQSSIGTAKDIDYEVRDALSTKKKQSSIGTAKDIDYEAREVPSTKKKQSSIRTTKDIDYEVREVPTTKKKQVSIGTTKDIEVRKGPSSPKKKHSGIGFTKDIDYEVREQEDDCNILVLKI